MGITIKSNDLAEIFTDPTVTGHAAPVQSRIKFGADTYLKIGTGDTDWLVLTGDVGNPSVTIAKGTTNVLAGTDAQAGPVTIPAAFLPDYALAVKRAVPGTTDVLTFRGSADGGDIDVFLETTAVADEYNVHIFNNSASAYDVAWSVEATKV